MPELYNIIPKLIPGMRRMKYLLNFLVTAMFFTVSNITIAQSTDIVGSAGSGRFGTVTVLTNGNYVVVDPNYDDGAIPDVGAVYLYNGSTHKLISTLKGNTANDIIGNGGVIALSNGNFVVSSPYWDNGAASNAGAVTWGDGTIGISGMVSISNSLVGSQTNDNIGSSGITALPSGNYVISSPYWNNGTIEVAGAVTWGNGASGISGVISSSNSLVGNTFGGQMGGVGVTVLSNGNYVLGYPSWNNGFGAATLCSGTTGRVGLLNSSNALVGSSSDQTVGNIVTALSNGNYVVTSYNWGGTTGAVTLCDGTMGTTGVVSSSNSLIGSSPGDHVGSFGVIALSNGNYLVRSPTWDNGAIIDAGAVTWGNGTTGITGVVSSSNSLVGSQVNDNIGNTGVTILGNGNYVVSSALWDNGSILDAGAVTWGSGETGIAGVVSSSNSLVGSLVNDNIGGAGVTSLTNGNYVVKSTNWDNGEVADVGAVTWCNGATGLIAVVSSSNSLIGASMNDMVGSGGVAPLSNGNYIVASPNWDNGAIANVGAATFCKGATGKVGTVSSSNSLTGSNLDDNVGNSVTALKNGNYVVRSSNWDNGVFSDAGAVTWANGKTGIMGVVNISNSLVGSSKDDNIGSGGITALSNGNYVVRSVKWDNGATLNAGAVTLGNGSAGLSGTVTSCNSVLGSAASGGSLILFAYDYTYNFLAVGRRADNIVTIYDPTGMLIDDSSDSQTVDINGTITVPFINNNTCRIIAALTSNGANPVSGKVSAKIWIESSVPTSGSDPFVTRHYEITPAGNASSATGRVTLYFTQQEFADFNNDPASNLNLPTGPSDAIGKSNLRIGKFSGSSNNNTGLPSSYSGSAQVIDPADEDIVWKSDLNRWEVSFNVTGFSGFIVQTKTGVLPLKLLEFNGRVIGDKAILNWKTTGELNNLSFDIERSTEGRLYAIVGNIPAVNTEGIHPYHYTDNNISSLNVPAVYYRLKQKDIDNHYTYSQIVALSIDNSNVVLFYPNPVSDKANLTVRIKKRQKVQAEVLDNAGRIIKQEHWFLPAGSSSLSVDVSSLVKGLYYLRLKGATFNERKQFLKQ